MDKFKNKYRIPSARASWWDYGRSGAYFITICTAQRYPFFGKIADGEMILSSVGQLAHALWHEIPCHAKDVKLGAFVVMPNHVHGILLLENPGNDGNCDNDNGDDCDFGHDHDCGYGHGHGHVETRHALSLQNHQQPQNQQNQPPPNRFQNQGRNTVSSMIGGYKSAVTKHARRSGWECAWQSRFHDHIIRNDDEFRIIHDYIETNPARWGDDKFYIPE